MKHEARDSTGALPTTEENFAERWSRLKRQPDEQPSESQAALLQQDDREPVKILTDEDMPDIDTLTPESDYTGFFSSEVSESLRRLALRKLFQGAEFNIRDGLDDYDQDFTSFTKLGSVITADMRHLLAQEQEHAAERDAAEAAEETITADGEDSADGSAHEAERRGEPAAEVSRDSEEPDIDELSAPGCTRDKNI